MAEQLVIRDVKALSQERQRKVGQGSRDRRRVKHLISTATIDRRITILPRDYHRLAIDRRYQREGIASWHNVLRDALLRGTVTPPIAVCERLFAEDGEVSKNLWVADGQQRMWAHVDLDLPILADVYKTESLQQEQALFIALNNLRDPSPNRIITAHPGPSARWLEEVTPKHAWIHAWDGGKRGSVQLSVVVAALARYFTGNGGRAVECLAALDGLLVSNANIERANALLTMIGASLNTVTSETVRALVKVLRARGIDKPPLTRVEMGHLHRLRLDTVTASSGQERVFLMARRIARSLGVTLTLAADKDE
jgi:hypothetical protein